LPDAAEVKFQCSAVFLTLTKVAGNTMERSTKYGEKSSMYEACAYNRDTDVKEASELMQSIFTKGTIGARLFDAERALRWGRNRVLEIFKGKARRIEGFEKDQLRALRARQLEAALIEARHDHTKFIAETARLEAMLTSQDAAFHGPEIEARRALVLRMDSSGNPAAKSRP
jgi:hypothetical protein